MSIEQDCTNALQKYFDSRSRIQPSSSDVICLLAMKCMLVRKWDKAHRILGFIRNLPTSENVLMLFNSPDVPDNYPIDLMTMDILAVDANFAFERLGEEQLQIRISAPSLALQNINHNRSRSNSLAVACSTSKNDFNRVQSIDLEFADADTLRQFADHVEFVRLSLAKDKVADPAYGWLRLYQNQMALIHNPELFMPTNSDSTGQLVRRNRLGDTMRHAQSLDALLPTSPNKLHRCGSVDDCDHYPSDSSSSSGEEAVDALVSERTLVADALQVSLGEEVTEQTNPEKMVKPRKVNKYMSDYEYRRHLNGGNLELRLKEKEADYTVFKDLKISICSWNVNGKQDPELNLESLLHPLTERPSDMYVFGFQEMEISLAGMALNKPSISLVESRWIEQLERVFGGLLRSVHDKRASIASEQEREYQQKYSGITGGGYEKQRVRLAGIFMIVYFTRRLWSSHHFRDFTTHYVPTGMFNFMGNKGGVGIRFSYHNSWLCFINCHLAAGEGNADRRNQDIEEILQRMTFFVNADQVSELRVFQHDLVFILGDLNYRVASEDSDEIKRLIALGELDKLIALDELHVNKETLLSFKGFQEQKLTFAPTYKFDMGSQNYDSSEKNRVPSYCDRVLWSGCNVQALHYQSQPQFVISDHKPVSASFNIGIRKVLKEMFNATYESIIRQEDKERNSRLPQATIWPKSQEVKFEEPIRFLERKRMKIELENVGLTMLHFTFLKDSSLKIPDWLNLHPLKGEVKVNERCEIYFDICITEKNVAAVNNANLDLYCILVLQLVDGKDYFIT
ncbi:hypothetical protein Ciccas_007902, partial [Cichlidogyrus casuarinus]